MVLQSIVTVFFLNKYYDYTVRKWWKVESSLLCNRYFTKNKKPYQKQKKKSRVFCVSYSIFSRQMYIIYTYECNY